MKTIRSVDELVAAELIDESEQENIAEVADAFSIAISEDIAKKLQSYAHPALTKQFVPSQEELTVSDQELADPIGDDKFTKVKGIVHRYPDRCLLKPVNVCPVYCRFCFRKEKIGPQNAALTPNELEDAYDYIRSTPEISEVIITGGDPLILKPKQLQKIIHTLVHIEHVDIIRIHTRVPVVEPARINKDMLDALTIDKALYLMIHTNHASEWSDTACRVVRKLSRVGISLLSQTVLLKGVNDNIDDLEDLMRFLVKHRVKPYYLHHGDLTRGTSHFRCSIEHGQQLVTQLRGRLSGLCQPEYVLDIPGGHGKSPIGDGYIKRIDDSNYEVRDYNGQWHHYCDC